MNKVVTELIENTNDEQISEMFINYVNSMGDTERHTETACNEVDAFDKFCEENFSNDIKKQSELYTQMMNVAVEFEESGFIAGVKWIINLLKESEQSTSIAT